MDGHFRRLLGRILLLGLTATILLCFYMGLSPLQDGQSFAIQQPDSLIVSTVNRPEYTSNHTLCVVVPFRDRFEELMEFVPHMHSFLNDQHIRHHIITVNQVDSYRFNRASLINVGFVESRTLCDYIAMHDVDLLPVNHALDYSYPHHGVFHVAAPDLHPLYHYKTFVGGILLVKSSDFIQLNGLSNKYWGWGREDDEFFVRMKKAGIILHRPVGLTTGNKTFRHVHDKQKRPRDNGRYFNQREKTRRLDRETGVNSVQYTMTSEKKMTIDKAPVTILNIKLHCNVTFTPWCLQPEDHDWYLQQYPQSR